MPTKTKSRVKAPPVNVILSTFDDRHGMPVYRSLRSGKIGTFPAVEFDEYVPTGNTPLLDATAKFIGHLESEHRKAPKAVTIGLLMDESLSMQSNRAAVIQGANEFIDEMRREEVDPDAGGKVLAVIVTDGEENRSTEVSINNLRKTFAEKEASGIWTFIFLGANQDAWRTGSNYGLSGSGSGQTVTTSGSVRGTQAAFRNVSSKARHFVSNNVAYHNLASSAPVTNLSEDGIETPVGQTGQSYGDIAASLRKAKGATR
jgi:hypothetical protein